MDSITVMSLLCASMPVAPSSATVSAAAGQLPAASSPAVRQSTEPCARCTTVPNALVIAAKARSVPTATAAGTPKIVSAGVTSEPPPTPLMPTSTPAARPSMAYSHCMAMSRVQAARAILGAS